MMVQVSLWLFENHAYNWKSVLWSFSNLWSRVHVPNPSQLGWIVLKILMKKREPVNTGSKFKPLSFFFIHCFKGAGFDPIFLDQIMSNLSHKDQVRLFFSVLKHLVTCLKNSFNSCVGCMIFIQLAYTLQRC
jgi:hypothetical protein